MRWDERRLEWNRPTVDVMKKQNINLNTTFYFLRLSQIQDHFLPTRFTSPHTPVHSHHIGHYSHYQSRAVTPRRHSGRCPELILSHKSCSLACSVRSSFLSWPPCSFLTGFLWSSKSPVFCGYHRTLKSSSTPAHCLFHNKIGRSTFARLGCCLLRTYTQPILRSFRPRAIPWSLCPAIPSECRISA